MRKLHAAAAVLLSLARLALHSALTEWHTWRGRRATTRAGKLHHAAALVRLHAVADREVTRWEQWERDLRGQSPGA